MRKLVLFFGFILLWNTGFATHQRAGEITYKHVSGLTYEFTIITYTYTPSTADRPMIDVFWGDNTSSSIPRQSKISVGPDISKNTYVTTHTFSSAGTYAVTFEDPNRNYGIMNIPNSVNIPFFIETIIVIDPFLGSNSSVQLLNPPLDNGCVGVTYYHNVGAYDPDGDSLSYKLIDCRGLDGLNIPGYVLPQASQYITINEVTGDLIWETPMIQGEYNIAILISEYRRGRFMGSVVRDMQITIAACNNKPPQIFRSDTCVVAGTLLSLDILVTDETSTQITLTATGAPFLVNSLPAIPLNVSGAPPLRTEFIWQTTCAHVKKTPYEMLLKATDNGPQVNLTSFKTVNIKVIAPAPENLTASAIRNTIVLQWDTYSCRNAKEIHIYKKADPSHFEPDICETGIPSNTGFQLLTKVDTSKTGYLDDGTIIPLTRGREYCYRIVAVFNDGAESIASNEACAAVIHDAPMITQVDVEQTSENEGVIFVSWLIPPMMDTLNFPGPKYEYRIFRSANNKNNFEYIASTYSLQDTFVIDKNLNTKEIQYFYKIEFWGENKQEELEYIETSDPASSIFLTIYETDKRLELTWNEQVPWKNEAYVIYRFNEGTQQFDSIAVTTNNYYKDIGLTNGMTYCYVVKSIGLYVLPDTLAPLYSRSQVTCGEPINNIPPNTPDTKITTDCENVKFWWSFPPSDSYLDADQYYIYYIYYQPNYQTPFVCIDSFFYVSPCDSPTFCSHIIQNLPSVTGCYAMLIKDEMGNESNMTPKLCFDVDECDVYSLPNVFTPDGDGINDTWLPFPYTNVQKINLEVHDRWGRRVFKTEDPDINWDGTDMRTGRPLPEGTYYYGCDVYLYTLDGIKKKLLTGIVMILRDNNKAKQRF
ncbi:MAG: gliding motility-associated C-terminal domain-containing protein [Bacteroidetes bacterium]|nr:gliding motility-associated C-terminal domain-containing protein [Bacteroidota bacterium]MCL2303439.1 gliding motility-associated C-terminal domain-containing protein [Lentimicrobiaceae bacterium]